MAEVINLRLARKAKARADAANAADMARAQAGESKAAKRARRDELARAKALLDGALREPE